MKEEKWKNLLTDIKEKFGLVKQKKEKLKFPEGAALETVIFKNVDGQKMKLERTTKPKVISEEIHYHKRTAESWTEYKTSPDEIVSTEKLFRWDGAQWQEIKWREPV